MGLRRFRIPAFCFMLFTWQGSVGIAEEISPEQLTFFESKIRSVLAEKCYSCHSAEAEKIKGGLRLDTREAIRKGGDIGPAIIPGDPENSLLLEAIHYENPDLEMPPKGRLPAQAVADLQKWIEMGAPDPREETGEVASSEKQKIDIEAGRKHWAFQPIRNPEVPKGKSDWSRTDADRFLLQRLEEKDLRAVSDATPVELLRRVHFDLTGLPPSAEEARHFAGLDPEAAQTEIDGVIDSLLDTREFGEHWGRHWLDVARYADSSGGAHNLPFPVAFRYRDYVVDAFEKDKPYDQFVREQLAGDLLPSKSPGQRNEQLTATGFLCVGIKDLRERDRLRYTMAIVEEQIDTVGRSLLGLTIACAKCHDHKFDPIPTEDYYGLAGIFASSEPQLGVRRNRLKDPLTTRLQVLEGSPVDFSDAEIEDMLKREVDMVPMRLGIRDEKRRLLVEAGLDRAQEKEQETFLEGKPTLEKMYADLEAAEAPFNILVEKYQKILPYSAMAMRDRSEPEDSHVHIRGDEKALGELVPRGFPAVLRNEQTPSVDPTKSGRIALADWIASAGNPLTARVMVNRIWQHLFGSGLVGTPDDFGRTGETPSNPELLDHLATRFIEEGWSVKSMIRYLMTSHAYRLGTFHNQEAWQIDPDNRLCWRMSRKRLDANALLDTLRQLSGTLQSGPPADPYIQPWVKDMRMKSIDRNVWLTNAEGHRAMYLPLWRDYIPTDLMVFDFPEPSLVVGKRDLTTVPTQALFLMNSPLVSESASRTAAKIEADTPAGFVELAYLRILNRPPAASEQADAESFLKSYPETTDQKETFTARAALCQALMATAEFRYLF